MRCSPLPGSAPLCTDLQVQPYLQKFLTALLTGARTDSELKGDYHSLFYAVGAGWGPEAAPWGAAVQEGHSSGGRRRAAASCPL